MLLLAAPVLEAPDDPASRGLWGLIALVLLIGLAVAHVRVLRVVARQLQAPPADDDPQLGRDEADDGSR